MTMNLSRVSHAFARPDIEPGHVVVDLDGKCISTIPIETAYELLASLGHAIVVREQEDAAPGNCWVPQEIAEEKLELVLSTDDLTKSGFYQ